MVIEGGGEGGSRFPLRMVRGLQVVHAHARTGIFIVRFAYTYCPYIYTYSSAHITHSMKDMVMAVMIILW